MLNLNHPLALKKNAPLILIDFLKVSAALLIILHHLSSYGQIAKDAHAALPSIMTWLFEYGRYALSQFLAHLFFIQGILGLDSISAGAWYVAIDWQLYSVLAILLITFPRYQAAIWVLSVLGVSSLLFFNRSGVYEAYFIYFIGAYGLGVLAYLAKEFQNASVNRLAKIMLFVIGVIILVSSFQQLWLRNVLAWMVAIALLCWGNKTYPAMNTGNHKLLSAIAWLSPRSYSAFLIHFALILLANTLYIVSNWHQQESGALAITLMLSVVAFSTIAANYLYRWVELPSRKIKV